MSSIPSKPSVHVVVVNWNAGSMLAECLRSFETTAADAVTLARVTVVDNGSTDNSLAGLKSLAADLPLEIISNDHNRGFAAACNQGARGSTADFLLFLNPDTRLQRGSLEVPTDFLADRKNSEVGIVGVQLVDSQGKVARSCARRPTVWSMVGQSLGLDRFGLSIFPAHFMTDWNHGETRIVDQVMGAFFFIRASIFKKLGGFDERFFVYFEELDLAVRACELGWICVYLANARVFHRGCGTTDQVRDVRLFYSWRSRILYAFKHFGAIGGTVIAIATLMIEPLVRIFALFVQGRVEEVRNVLRATHLVWAHLPQMARGNTQDGAT